MVKGGQKKKNLHRNLLLSVVIFNSEDHVELKPVQAPRKKRSITNSTKHTEVLEKDAESEDADADADDDDNQIFFIFTKITKSVPRLRTGIPWVSLDHTGDDQNDRVDRLCKPYQKLMKLV